jgi:hypothetical protein
MSSTNPSYATYRDKTEALFLTKEALLVDVTGVVHSARFRKLNSAGLPVFAGRETYKGVDSTGSGIYEPISNDVQFAARQFFRTNGTNQRINFEYRLEAIFNNFLSPFSMVIWLDTDGSTGTVFIQINEYFMLEINPTLDRIGFRIGYNPLSGAGYYHAFRAPNGAFPTGGGLNKLGITIDALGNSMDETNVNFYINDVHYPSNAPYVNNDGYEPNNFPFNGVLRGQRMEFGRYVDTYYEQEDIGEIAIINRVLTESEIKNYDFDKSECHFYAPAKEGSGLDWKDLVNGISASFSNGLTSMIQTDAKGMGYSYLNEFGYNEVSGVYKAASLANPNLGSDGNQLVNKGKLNLRAQLKNATALLLNGTTQKIQFDYEPVSIYLNGADDTVNWTIADIGGGNWTIAPSGSKTVYNLLINGTQHYTCMEGNGVGLTDDSGNGNHAVITNAVLPTIWTATNNYHYAHVNGYWSYKDGSSNEIKSAIDRGAIITSNAVTYNKVGFVNGAKQGNQFNGASDLQMPNVASVHSTVRGLSKTKAQWITFADSSDYVYFTSTGEILITNSALTAIEISRL